MRRWFAAVEDVDLYVSVLVVAEIRRGIQSLRRRDLGSAKAVERWLTGLERRYEDRILPVTLEICHLWGGLSVERPVAPIDGLMAATALHHGPTLVTRNIGDVERSGSDVFNPFQAR